MFYSTSCSCKCIFIFVIIDMHAYIGGLQRLNTQQRYCVRNCALRGLAHRNFSSRVLTIRALYDAFEIVISRIVTFLKSFRNCLVSLYLRFSFEIVTPDLEVYLFYPNVQKCSFCSVYDVVGSLSFDTGFNA